MKSVLPCPACHQELSIAHLFLTPTLLRFRCRHCRAHIKPRTLGKLWLVLSVLLGLCVGVLLTTGQISPIQALVIGIAGIAAIKLATSIQVANTTELQKADRSSD
ncbi:MAG: hypothetical protein IH939_11315 [Acidobacteria bacterium]|nr:hypothetical protein [Acidobacteriota bacterium]